MNSIVSNMNDILAVWKEHHDIFSSIPSAFSIEKGFLCFDNHSLCQADDDLTLFSADSSAEGLQFFLNDRRSIVVTIEWPENQPPVVSSVSLLYLLAPREVFEIE